ncbi:pyruvate formate lyase activating enzyme [Desulfobaculum xiamenense]|uniref:Pyruvate formate lyase activating enzyme n=1 Tax=Desulfobaculum xiamenense TaxID=995050 RepID=A0A846QFY3_9BACT|nr:anaerobic ribonucleoside-triphosphate reductase activating protein [Desulfobaculum xiamenense]NJB67706.1 pyruvate formate lyase activating enzyme [Desulfobaculum xiamenense]
MEPWKFVRGFERFSLCDWPGNTCCVVFLGGCNLHCPTCHNGEMAWRHESLPRIDKTALLGFLSRRAKWLDGITVTGGEPTTVPGLSTFLADLGSAGLPIKLDTNGMRPDVVRELAATDLVKTFAVDVKGPFAKYPALTGNAVDAAEARANIEQIFDLARSAPGRFYFRTTKVPMLTDEDIETVRGYLPAGFALTEQKYVAPRRTPDAQTDSQTGRLPGDMVAGSDCECHIQGPQGQRHQGSAALQAVGS